jgi:NitT/TauT family transport system substrate-binding protein
MSRWLSLRSTLVLALVVGSFGCRDAAPPPLRIGVPVWPGYEPAYLARDLGFLDSTQVVLVDFLDGAMASRAFHNGGIDAVMQTLPTAISSAETDSTLRAVLVLDVSAGADGLVGGPSISTIAALRGKAVGIDASGTGAVVVARALQKAGMTFSDVTLRRMDATEAEKALFDGRLAAVLTYEPLLSGLLARGAHALFTSAEMPGEISDVLVVDGAALQGHDAALRHFAAAWFKGRAALLADPPNAARRLAARESTTEAAFLAMLRGLSFPDEAENAQLMQSATSPMHSAARAVSAEMQRQGMLHVVPNLERLIDTRLLAAPR